MQISLLSHFQGTLVGAAAANILGAYRQQVWGKQSMPSRLDSDYWHLDQWGGLSAAPPAEAWGSLWVNTLNDWIEAGDQNWSHLGQSCGEIELSNPATSAIALLPLILIAHGNQMRQRQALASTMNLVGWDSSALVAALIVAIAMNSALHNRLAPLRLLSHLSLAITGWRHPADNQSDEPSFDPEVLTEALQTIHLLQTLIQAPPIELEAAAEKLQEISSRFGVLGLALYCFLSTPTEYDLTVIRALRCGRQPQLVATLAGILSGFYNGLGGIPIAWRLGVQHRQTGPAAISILWRIPSETVLNQLSELLLAGWAGADKQFIQSINFKHPIHTFESRQLKAEKC